MNRSRVRWCGSWCGCSRLRPISVKRLAIVLGTSGVFIIIFLRLLATDVVQQSEVEKCPACFGHSLCPRLGQVRLLGWDWFHYAYTVLNVKNVLFGQLDHHTIVLKKLAHNAELMAADKLICTQNITRHSCSVNSDCGPARLPPGCDISSVAQLLTTGLTFLTPELVRGLAPMTYCPTQRLLKRMTDKYLEHEAPGPLLQGEIMTMLYTLMVNAEPLILQTFPASEGWPFPAYVGACGRFTAEEYIGRTVADFFDAEWSVRADIAWQIMKIADQFTENSVGFRLFWTDLDLSNLGVNDEGRVFVIDAEDIYVVDVQNIYESKPQGWITPDYHQHDDCAEGVSCLTFNPDVFCSKADSDFNFYTACRALSPYGVDAYGRRGGLLHDPPSDLEAHDVRQLRTLLDECVRPTKPYARLYAKEQLLLLLSEMAG